MTVPEGVKQVIFDVDMTLIDSFPGVYLVYCEVAEQMGLAAPTEQDLRVQWGKTVPEIIAGLWDDQDADEIYRVAAELAVNRIHPLLPGVIEVVSRLGDEGFGLGILSSCDRELFVFRLEAAGLDLGCFDPVVGGSDSQCFKPDPGVFARFLKRQKPDQLLYVGDDLGDFQAAEAAGVSFWAVASGFTAREEFLAAGLAEDNIFPSMVALFESL